MSASISSLASTGLAGMQAAQQRLDTAAGRIAGMRVPVAGEAAGAPAEGVSVSIGSAPAGSNLADLTGAVIDQKVAAYAFKANLLVLETADRLHDALLDVRA